MYDTKYGLFWKDTGIVLIFLKNPVQLTNDLVKRSCQPIKLEGVVAKGQKTNGKNKDFFALDIGSSSVKVLQLSGKNGQWTIQGIGHSPITRAVVADKSIVDNVGLAAAIEKAVQQAKIKTKHAYAAIPAAQTTSKTITIPANLSVLEQEDFVQLEAQNHIPFPIDEVRMDFEVLDKSKAGSKTAGSDETDTILLVATKIDQLQNRVDAITSADIQVDVMDVDQFAIERAMKYIIGQSPLTNVEDPIEVVIDLGHEFTVLHVLHEGRAIYNREQNFGMKQLTDEVGRRFGLSMEQTQIGISKKQLPEEFQKDILPSFRSEVAGQVNRLIQFFFAGTSFNRVHRIWVLGGGAALDGLAEEISEVTGVPTRIVNPLEHLNTSKNVDTQYIHDMGSAFLTAFGLAIRED